MQTIVPSQVAEQNNSTSEANGYQKIETAVPRFAVYDIYPSQVYRFWPDLRQAFIESMTGFIELDETALQQYQNQLIGGRLGSFLCVDEKERRVLCILVYQIVEDELLGIRFATVYAFKASENIPWSAWKACGTQMIDQFRYSKVQQIRVIVQNDKLKQLLQHHGFDTSRVLATLTIGA